MYKNSTEQQFKTTYVTDQEKAQHIVENELTTDEVTGLDIETMKLPKFQSHEHSGLNPHLSKIRLVQVCQNLEDVYVFDIQEIGLDLLRPILAGRFVAHNAVFELLHLYHAGVELPRIDCTMLMENAIKGGRPSLQELAKKYLQLTISKELQDSDWGDSELSQEQLGYAALDAWIVKRLYDVHMDIIVSKNKTALYNLLADAQYPVMKMQYDGVHFDATKHYMLTMGLNKQLEDAKSELEKVIGPNTKLSSNKQLSDHYKKRLSNKTLKKWKRTKTGDLCLDKDTVSKFSHIKEVEPLAEYKKVKKKIESFGDSLREQINPATGRIHPNYSIGAATGGRFTCSKPNIQQIPKDQEFRRLFNAPSGKKIVFADYSQIELRVLAMITGDSTMLKAYQDGKDLHELTASATSGIPVGEVTKEQRKAAKAVNFGLVFGMGTKSLAEYAKNQFNVHMTSQEAKNNKDAFFQKYPGVSAWHNRTTRNSKSIGIAKTKMGRVEKLDPEKGYTQSKNIPVQGSAAEVMLAALVELNQRITESGLDMKLVNIVHDEIVLEVDKNIAEQARDILEESMKAGMLRVFPESVTDGLVEAAIADSWGDE